MKLNARAEVFRTAAFDYFLPGLLWKPNC